MANSSLNRDTLAYGLAVLTDRLVGFFLLPWLTAGLSKEDFGAWSQVFTSYGLISNLLLLGFYHTVSGLVAGRQHGDAARIYKGILGIVLVNCLLLSGLLLVAPEIASHIVFGVGTFKTLMLYSLLFFITECFYELTVLAFLRAEGRIALCAGFHMGKNLLRLPMVIVGLTWHDPLPAILVLISLGNVVLTLMVLFKYILAARPSSCLPVGFWHAAVGKSVMVTGVLALAWGIASSNRFLVVHFLSLEDLAVYSLNYSILSIATLVPMVISFTLLHHVSHFRALEKNDKAQVVLQESVALYLYAILPLLLLTGLYYQQLLGFLANPGYEVGFSLIASLLGYFFLFGLEQILVFATFSGNHRSAFYARLFALAWTLGLGVVLIPRYGIAVAVLPALLASASIVFWCSVTLWRELRYRFPWLVLQSVGPAWAVMLAAGILLTRAWPVQALWEVCIAAALLTGLYVLTETLIPTSLTRRLNKEIREIPGKSA